MDDKDLVCDRVRRERLLEHIEEILRIRGAQDSLTSRQDVITFAVEELWRTVVSSRSAELYCECTWRNNLK
jgi:hypothetical protein